MPRVALTFADNEIGVVVVNMFTRLMVRTMN